MNILDINYMSNYIMFWAKLLKYCKARNIIPSSLLKINFNFLNFAQDNQDANKISTEALSLLKSSFPIIITNILEDLLKVYRLNEIISIKHNYELIYLSVANKMLKIEDVYQVLFIQYMTNKITPDRYTALKQQFSSTYRKLHDVSDYKNNFNVLSIYDKFITSYNDSDRRRRSHKIILSSSFLISKSTFINDLLDYFEVLSIIYYQEETENGNE